MNSPVPDTPLRGDAQARLDQLIAQIDRYQDGQAGLVREHLASARGYLLGSMPVEYAYSLNATKEAAAGISDAALQKAVLGEVEDLLDQGSGKAPQPEDAPPARKPETAPPEDAGKSELYRFFRGSPTTLGVFYPTDYIFASFASLRHASDAAKALQDAGFRELVVASAQETLRFMNEVRSETGIWGQFMSAFSRFLGTEEVFTDIDLDKAEDGAGFLAIYCPQEDQAERIRDLVAPFQPQAMQLYLASGVRSLWAGKWPGHQGIH